MNVTQIKIPVINVIMQFSFKLNKYNFKKFFMSHLVSEMHSYYSDIYK